MTTRAGIVALGLIVGTIGSTPSVEPTTNELLEAIQQKLKAVHETTGPSVAWVVVSRSDKYPKTIQPTDTPGRLGGFDPKEFLKEEPGKTDLALDLDLSDPRSMPDHGFAGGVVIDSKGLILTNYHTIDGAVKIFVHLHGGQGSYADIQAADARSDLAVLRLLTPPPGLVPITFGEVRLSDTLTEKATVFKGKLVVLLPSAAAGQAEIGPRGGGLGSILGFDRKTSPRIRVWGGAPIPIHHSVYHYAPVIRHNARLDFGCSGLPLLNLNGELIGLTTTIAGIDGGENGPGHALPFDSNIKRIVEVLRRGEEVEYGFLGVIVAPGEERGGRGIIVTITPQGPAAAGGLVADERTTYMITRINGHPVKTYEDLLLHAGSALAGSKIRLEVYKEPDTDPLPPIEVTLGKYRGDTPFIASVRPAAVFGLRVDYGTVLIHNQSSGVGIPPGVAVRELLPASPAFTKFKALGENTRWLITHVNGTPTPSPAEFYRATTGQESVKLSVIDLQLNTRHSLTLP